MEKAWDAREKEWKECWTLAAWDAREKEYREHWYAREKRWAASLGEESLEEWLDSVMALAKAAFAIVCAYSYVWMC